MASKRKSREPSREIAQLKFPVHRLRAVLKVHPVRADKFLQMIFVAAEVAEIGGVAEREFQRRQRVVKTYEPNPAGKVARDA